MKWISRCLAGLLALALTAVAGAWVLHGTIWSTRYVTGKTEDIKLADQLAPALAKVLAAGSGGSGDTVVIIGDALTPAYVQSQLNTLVAELERYYLEGGQIPRLDTSDLKSRIAAAGYVVTPELAATLDRPQEIHAGQADGAIRTANRQAQQLLWLAPLAAVILAGCIALLAGRRRWLVLAGAALSAALGVLMLAAAAWLPPSLLQSTLSTSAVAPLAGPVRVLVEAVARDQSHQLVWLAAGLAGAGLILGLTHMALKLRQRFQRPPKTTEPPARRL